MITFLTQRKFKGRKAGKRAFQPVIDYIAKELNKAGYEVVLQPISRTCLTNAIGAPRKGKYPKKMTNIIARLESKDTNAFIIVGAHFDHLGKRWALGKIHPGADDNASGIAALLSIVRMVKTTGEKPERTLLFCAWDGEKKGLLGSRYFVSKWYEKQEAANPNLTPTDKTDSIYYYMNFDMVGRTATPNAPAVTFARNNNYPNYLSSVTRAANTHQPPLKFYMIREQETAKAVPTMPRSRHTTYRLLHGWKAACTKTTTAPQTPQTKYIGTNSVKPH